MRQQYGSHVHHRRSIRLKGYAYSQAGAYFVTICAKNRECLFGEIIDAEMRLNECGSIVLACWDKLPQHFPNVDLDEFVVMPNHVHGIIVIAGERVGAQHAAPLQPAPNVSPGSLGAIIRSFKSAVTQRVNDIGGIPGAPLWQRNYFEHIIRNEKDLNRVREYIAANPARWTDDENNLSRVQMELRRRSPGH